MEPQESRNRQNPRMHKAPYSAIYPMGVYSSMDNVTVPARQKYQAGKADEKSVVMLGYSATEKKIKLQHVMAFLKLTVNKRFFHIIRQF